MRYSVEDLRNPQDDPKGNINVFTILGLRTEVSILNIAYVPNSVNRTLREESSELRIEDQGLEDYLFPYVWCARRRLRVVVIEVALPPRSVSITLKAKLEMGSHCCDIGGSIMCLEDQAVVLGVLDVP
jgi:hypothetical protein